MTTSNTVKARITLDDIKSDDDALRHKTLLAIKDYVRDNNELDSYNTTGNRLAKVTIEPIYTPVFSKVYSQSFDEDGIACFNVVEHLNVNDSSQFEIISITVGLEASLENSSPYGLSLLTVILDGTTYFVDLNSLDFQDLYAIFICLSTEDK